MKKPKSYLFIVKQGKEESLKGYIVRFNYKTLQIEGCNDDLSLSAIMVGLKVEKLL